MFWGLIMEPGKKYSQTVQKSFHISHAALDLDTARNDPVQVLLGFDGRNYLICTLQKGEYIQAPLDLNFQVGDKVSFATNGPGHVHLTGYLVPEDDFTMDDVEEEEEAESEDEVPELVPAKKRKAKETVATTDAKKSKTIELLNDIAEDDSEDSDDSDVDMSDLLEDNEEAEEEEDESADDVVEDDSGDEEEDESEDEEVEQVKPKTTPVKQNGVAKKDKTPKANQVEKKESKTPQQNERQQKDKTPKGQKTPGKEGTPKGQKTPGKEGTPSKKTIEGGVVIEDLKLGDGQVAKPGRLVQVYYEGRLKSNNKMFDSSTKGPGFKFRIGRQEVIKAWDVGVTGMKIGGKRRITCPPNMAYGAQGSPPVIPANSTLVFEVELKSVK